MQNISEKITGAEHLTEVIAYLKNADKYIRHGDIRSALDEIVHAREKNPTIMYARAYEEYVRSVLMKHADRSEQEEGSNEAAIRQLMPTLERILDLAIKEVKRSAVTAYRQKEVIALQIKHEEVLRSEEQQRAGGIAKKIAGYLQRARVFGEQNDFHNALNELARAFMLNPTDEQIPLAEQEIKTAQANRDKEEAALVSLRQQEERKLQEQLYTQREQQRLKEKVEEQRNKEESYKQARTQKIREYLHVARGLFAENKIEEARSQLAFVMVIDPLNEEVLDLDWKISEAQTKKQEESKARKKQKDEDERKKADTVRSTVLKSLEKAEEALSQQKFSEALRIITQAYYIDPANELVIACEKKIMAAEEEALRQKEEQWKSEEDERRRKQETELHRLGIEQQKREQIRERVEAETKLLHDEEEILLFLSKARGFISQGNFEDALKQVALAFKINPFDEEITRLQREILEGHKKVKRPKTSPVQTIAELENPGDLEILEAIQRHTDKAKEFRTKLQFQEALDEIAQAYRLDPMNEMLFALEGEIQQEFLRYEEELRQAEENFKKDQGIKKSLAMARESLSRDAYGEALAWVDYAMSFNMQHAGALQMKDEIERAQQLIEGKKALEEKEIAIQYHLNKAKEFLSARRNAEAIFEADLALRLNPSHHGALEIRKQLSETSS